MTREDQIKKAEEIIAYGCSDELRDALIKDFPELAGSKEIEDLRMIDNLRYIVHKCATLDNALDVNGDLCENEYIEVDNWLRDLKDSIQTQNSK